MSKRSWIGFAFNCFSFPHIFICDCAGHLWHGYVYIMPLWNYLWNIVMFGRFSFWHEKLPSKELDDVENVCPLTYVKRTNQASYGEETEKKDAILEHSFAFWSNNVGVELQFVAINWWTIKTAINLTLVDGEEKEKRCYTWPFICLLK